MSSWTDDVVRLLHYRNSHDSIMYGVLYLLLLIIRLLLLLVMLKLLLLQRWRRWRCSQTRSLYPAVVSARR